jgi:DNA-directed RNA polymerase specialized sigma24 family protein
MVRKNVTNKKKRLTYKYYDAFGKVVEEIRPVDEETELLIADLHQCDIDEFNAGRRENYHIPISLDEYNEKLVGGESVNRYLGDDTYNPYQIILDAFDEEDRMKKVSKVRAVFASLTAEQQELVTKVFIEKRTRVDVAAEEGVSETAIRKRLATIRKKFEKEFKK